MTWEELVEFAKDYGLKEMGITPEVRHIEKVIGYNIVFCENGEILQACDYDVIAEHRTYEQMKTIIENMYDKRK